MEKKTNAKTNRPAILVVDDLEANREVARRRLERRGFRVIVAEGGKEALQIIGRENISLILLDINMPEMNGLEMLRVLRGTLGDQAPPVIMLTAVDSNDDISGALDSGAADYVTKPFDFKVLESRIRRQLRNAEKKAKTESSAASMLREAMALKDERTTDVLTKLPTRQQFDLRLAVLYERSGSGTPHACALLLDLDGFKAVNDAYGQTEGDRLLKNVADYLRSGLRISDFMSRLSGDRFAIILERCDHRNALAKTHRMLKGLAELNLPVADGVLSITASGGIVDLNMLPMNVAVIMNAMETACAIAKEKGRNQCYVHREEDGVVRDLRNIGMWAVKLKRGMSRGDLLLYAQPIVEARAENRSESHRRYELLLRLMDNGQIVSPGVFLAAAARHGLAVELDRWVFDHAYEFLSAQDEVRRAQLESISLNLSGQSLASERLQRHIQRKISSGTLPPSLFCFEITETAAVADLDRAIAFMTELQSLGVSFALDDFGTGVSSFAYLKELPVDYVKIDGQFVRSVGTSDVDLAIVSSIQHIAGIMGKKTVAEFVENETVADALGEIGIDYLQGYFFGKPALLSEVIHPQNAQFNSAEGVR